MFEFHINNSLMRNLIKEKDKSAESKSCMWVFIGGPPEKRNFIYEYHPTRTQTVPKEYWQDFKGFLHTFTRFDRLNQR